MSASACFDAASPGRRVVFPGSVGGWAQAAPARARRQAALAAAAKIPDFNRACNLDMASPQTKEAHPKHSPTLTLAEAAVARQHLCGSRGIGFQSCLDGIDRIGILSHSRTTSSG